MSGLTAYQPSKENPWDRPAAMHLLRRAGFSPSEAEIRAALDLGPSKTVEQLVNNHNDSPRARELDGLADAIATRDDIQGLRGWWLHKMRHTRRPLHARMAVFWHNHFATSNEKVRSASMMLTQLRTFERHALGRFGELLKAVARDPAMIVWLDGQQNTRGRPNENFARELFELFTLGVGNYTERDIKEAARAFTGWHQRGGRFYFAVSEHDEGVKHVLGESGKLDGDDCLRVSLSQPAAAAFLAARLLREFLTPNPSSELVEAVAAELRDTEFDIAATLKTLLASEAMFDPRHRGVRIKSPVEFATGIARSLDLRVPAERLADAVSEMGQRLFEPPSVKGWDGHRAWLNSATMLVRLNAAARAVQSGDNGLGFDAAAMRQTYNVGNDDVIAFCENLTLNGAAPDSIHRQLLTVKGNEDEKMRSALRLLLSSPEYQMA